MNSGYHGINAGCMQAGCNLKVCHSHYLRLLDQCPREKPMYWKWLCKSYTDDNKNIQWCSNLQCGVACERTDTSKMLYDV